MSTAQESGLITFKQECTICEEFAKKGKYEKAIECFEKVHSKFPEQMKPYIRLCELYYLNKDKIKILYYANKAIDSNPNEAWSPLTYLANKMMSNRDDDIGLLILNRLSVSDLDTLKLSKAEKNRINYSMRANSERSPGLVAELKNLGDSINTKENEYLPSISLDGRTLVFTRNAGGNEDFFMAQRDTTNQYWKRSGNLGYPPNTNLPDGGAKISADGNYLFYTRCDIRSPDGIRGGGCDVVFSFREDGGWSSPQYFGYTINTSAYEGQPCLSSNNKELYFVSNREGGFGGMDIWVARYNGSVWAKPENLGPVINSEGDESAPYIHPDNETLYFASNSHPGLGSSDLFLSRKNKDGAWLKPINLGSPINTEKFDGSIVVNAKGTIGYSSSDREDSRGGLDLYAFNLHPGIKPIPTLCIKGFLIDKYYKNHIYKKKIDFINTSTLLTVGEEISNAGDGSYTKALQMGNTYWVQCKVDEYRTYYKKIALMSDTLPDIIQLNIKLKRPGFIDTLLQAVLSVDSTHLVLDSFSLAVVDTLGKQWDNWIEDSARVVIFVKGYYYSGDSLTDSTYKANLDRCLANLNLINALFKKKKIDCQVIMQDAAMIIYKDDEELFNKIEMSVVEYY